MYWTLLILVVCVFVTSLFVLDGKMVGFGDNCSFITCFKLPENGVNDVSSSWKNGSLALKQRKKVFFVIFGTSMMILQ
jgi:hypothetical protein